MPETAPGNVRGERHNPLGVDAVVRHARLPRVPGGILVDRVPGSMRHRQEATRLLHGPPETRPIVGAFDQAPDRIGRIIARIDEPVEIVHGDHQRLAQPVRDHLKGGMEEVKPVWAEPDRQGVLRGGGHGMKRKAHHGDPGVLEARLGRRRPTDQDEFEVGIGREQCPHQVHGIVANPALRV
jgi:hypothetical protein